MPLSIEQVSFGYDPHAGRGAPFLLHDVSATIERGSLTGLLGPNGCGKTTLLKLVAGVLRPGRGRIAVDGRRIDQISRRELATQLALVPQETHPAFDYTTREMVLMGRHPHLRRFQLEGPADSAIALKCLEATGTGHLVDRAYMTLSGGEKQRVIVASALAQEPQILLLDEPTASLDLTYQIELASLLQRLNRDRGVTMVLATHDLNLAASICDTLVLMRDGRVLAHGPTRDVLTAAAIRLLYDVDADVHEHADTGQLTVIPVRRTS